MFNCEQTATDDYGLIPIATGHLSASDDLQRKTVGEEVHLISNYTDCQK